MLYGYFFTTTIKRKEKEIKGDFPVVQCRTVLLMLGAPVGFSSIRELDLICYH